MTQKRSPSPHDRSSGILLHPTSLPGRFGIGDLGPAAFTWVESLNKAGQSWWQVLPLSPTGFGDSPYQSVSTFAGNPNLISPEALVQDGLLTEADLLTEAGDEEFPVDRVDFDRVTQFKTRVLKRAWENFRDGAAKNLHPLFERFQTQESDWLEDYALFMALKEAHGGASWLTWPKEYVMRDESALARASQQYSDDIGRHEFIQFLFFRQLAALLDHAHVQGVGLIGDLPIFVAEDSADVWAHSDLFQLDDERRPAFVAGVPPDYFSTTGQLWGNPLYNWPAHEKTGYAWWVARARAALRQVDLVRLDHFRGLEAYWEIPAGMPTAEIGSWVKGPGAGLLETLRTELAGLPLIAEDLGVITPEVDALRHEFELPGMCILQFAFGGAQEDRFLPHNHERRTVVYTGTHDNETTTGWFEQLTPQELDYFERYAPGAGKDPAWTLIRLAWASVAKLAIAPLQDVLGLGSPARMNVPGRASGNWDWRFCAEALTPALLDRLRGLTDVYGRSCGHSTSGSKSVPGMGSGTEAGRV